MNEHIWNHVVNRKVWNNSKHVLYLRFLKIATLCSDDCFAHSYANPMGWHVAAGCCGSHAGSVWLQFWINPQQCHQRSTPTPSHLLLHASRLHSPFLRRIKTRQVEPKISNLDKSDQSTDFHWSNVHSLCFLAQTHLSDCCLSFVVDFSSYLTIKAWFAQSPLDRWCRDVSAIRTLCSIHLGFDLRCC